MPCGEGSEFFCELRFERAGDGSNDRGTWAEGKRAVVVESHPRWQSVIREHLEAWGMFVQCFQRAEQALEHIRADADVRFDVAVIGTELSGLPIDEFIRQLRSTQAGAKLPIAALYQLGPGSFVSDVEEELAAQLPKPLRFSELYNVLQQTLIGERMPSGRMHSSGSHTPRNEFSVCPQTRESWRQTRT